MNDLTRTIFQLDPLSHWSLPIVYSYVPEPHMVELFDANGYDFTELEKLYAVANQKITQHHRPHRHTYKQQWFDQAVKYEGAVLNHSLLFERKGYAGAALTQLLEWAKINPLLHKVAQIRPKWGLDFSMDYADKAGNVFEVLHWEYDGFSYDEIEQQRLRHEPIFLGTDWDHAAQQLLARREEWYHLDFFAQSNWKCDYFGVARERFKMVIWK